MGSAEDRMLVIAPTSLRSPFPHRPAESNEVRQRQRNELLY